MLGETEQGSSCIVVHNLSRKEQTVFEDVERPVLYIDPYFCVCCFFWQNEVYPGLLSTRYFGWFSLRTSFEYISLVGEGGCVPWSSLLQVVYVVSSYFFYIAHVLEW